MTLIPSLRRQYVLSGTACVLLLGACGAPKSGGDQKGADGGSTSDMDGGMPMMKTADPSADSQALLDKIKDYDSWPKFDENSTPKLSESHMKMYVVTYHNDVVAQAITSNTLPLPEGSIIVKDNFAHATDAMPMVWTVMSKQNGQWYWLEATPEGKVVVDDMGHPLEGNDVQMCVSCHSQKKDTNDWVFTHQF